MIEVREMGSEREREREREKERERERRGVANPLDVYSISQDFTILHMLYIFISAFDRHLRIAIHCPDMELLRDIGHPESSPNRTRQLLRRNSTNRIWWNQWSWLKFRNLTRKRGWPARPKWRSVWTPAIPSARMRSSRPEAPDRCTVCRCRYTTYYMYLHLL